jgi:hypothetical protein
MMQSNQTLHFETPVEMYPKIACAAVLEKDYMSTFALTKIGLTLSLGRSSCIGKFCIVIAHSISLQFYNKPFRPDPKRLHMQLQPSHKQCQLLAFTSVLPLLLVSRLHR